MLIACGALARELKTVLEANNLNFFYQRPDLLENIKFYKKENALIFDQILECVKSGDLDKLQIDGQLLDQIEKFANIKHIVQKNDKDEGKIVKVIAGKYDQVEGPMKGHNVEPIYFDIELKKDKEFIFDLPITHNSLIYLVNGEIKIGDKEHEIVKDSTLILLSKGENLKVKGILNSKFLLISGKPINEQIARGGPFVMNTKSEILQAVNDYHNGNFVK